MFTKQVEDFMDIKKEIIPTELDITDDQQFDFYKGMIQSKGTGTSLSRIGRSNKIIQGEMNVYDEWALKVGDFGDVANDQSIELKITKSNVVQDPQLISLAFPQDTRKHFKCKCC